MNKEMTGVYAGRLLYEYSVEGNRYGIIYIFNDQAGDAPDMKIFEDILAKHPPPTGDGGFVQTTYSVRCTSKDASWLLDNDSLLSILDEAQKACPPQPECIYDDWPTRYAVHEGWRGHGAWPQGRWVSERRLHQYRHCCPGLGSRRGYFSGQERERPTSSPMGWRYLAADGLVGFFTLAGTPVL